MIVPLVRTVATVLLLGLLACPPAAACTAFQLLAQDGAAVYCRSMEFGFPFNSQVLIIPRGSEYQGTTPTGKPGLTWNYFLENFNQRK